MAVILNEKEQTAEDMHRRRETMKLFIHNSLEIAVNYTGEDISEERRGHVFDRFGQTEEDHSTKFFGLDLTFCHSVVEAHGGTICVDDGNSEVGTKFVFTLPVTRWLLVKCVSVQNLLI